jgi:hypothetical protein
VLTLRGRESVTITTRAGIMSQTCDITISADVTDGNDSISTRSIAIGACVSTPNCVPGTYQPNTNVWTLTNSSSVAPHGLTVTFPAIMAVQCGMAGRVLIPGPSSCVDGVAGSIATLTPGATVTITLICQVPFTAGGMITMVTGMRGIATFKVTLSGTTDATRDGISIS